MANIAIAAQIEPGVTGGTGNFLLGLIHGLAQLQDGRDHFTIIGTQQNEALLRSYMGANQTFVCMPSSIPNAVLNEPSKKFLRSVLSPLVQKIRMLNVRYLLPNSPTPYTRWPTIPISDGFYEKLGCDLIHFPYQFFVLCALPSIYQPWDLQQLHYPQFFTPDQIAWREVIFPGGCRLSTKIVVASHWVKRDIIKNYGIHPTKIHVVPVAAPLQAVKNITDRQVVRQRYALPAKFMMFPAVTWPHKNHIRLLEAIAKLRDEENFEVHLVCTGTQEVFWPHIEQRLKELNLQKQVQFLGHIPAEDLRAIYRDADFIVFPSLFEGAGMPPLEAWVEGKAVICSSATSLPEIVDNAALIFDPLNVASIATAVKQMASNDSLRRDFEEKGKQRVKSFSWERTALIYSVLYRQMLKQALSNEDRAFLSETI